MRFLKNGNLKDKEIEKALRDAADNYASGELMEVKETLSEIIDAIEEWAESDY